jgi:hypothetical protein
MKEMTNNTLLNPLFVKRGITSEMVDWYYKKINRHMELVRKYCRKMIILNPSDTVFKELEEVYLYHDNLKFDEPEFLPYIQLTWLQKTIGYKGYTPPGTLLDKEISDATMHHVKHSKHHPEFWDGRNIEFNLPEDRNAPAKGVIVDGTIMPDVYIAEMVADWMGMSEELGNSEYRNWAKKNINIRWKFSEHQEKFIYSIIDCIPIDI